MAETKEINLEVKSNLGGSIAELKALKRELKNASVGSDEFKKIFGQIDDLEDKIKSAKNASSDWVDTLENAGGPLGMVGAAINKAKVATQSFGAAFKAAGIGLVVSLVAGLAAAFSQNEGTMKKLQPLLIGFQKIFNGIFRALEPLFNTLIDLAIEAMPMVTKAFGVAYSAASSFFDSIGLLGKAIGKLIKGDFAGAWETAKSSVKDFGKNYDASLKRFNDGTKELTNIEKEEAEKRRLQREKEAADKKARDDKAAAIEKTRFDKQKTEREKDAENQFLLDTERKEREEAQKAKADKKVIDDFAKMSSTLKDQRDKAYADYKSDADKKAEIDRLTYEGKRMMLSKTSDLLGQFSEMLGQQTAEGKALAIAQATINAYLGISEVWKAPNIYPEPFGTGVKIASTIAVAASAFANVKKILAVQVPGGGGGGSMPSMESPRPAPAAPSFNVVGTSGVNQIAQGLGNQSPVQAYVVGSQVTTQQALDRNIVRTATLGG